MGSHSSEKYLRSRKFFDEVSLNLAKAEACKWQQYLDAAKRQGRDDLVKEAELHYQVYAARVSELEAKIKSTEIAIHSHIHHLTQLSPPALQTLSKKIDHYWLGENCRIAIFLDFLDRLLKLPDEEFLITYLAFTYSIPAFKVRQILNNVDLRSTESSNNLQETREVSSSELITSSITIPLEPEVAKAYHELAPAEREVIQMLVSSWLKQTAIQHSVNEIAPQIQARAHQKEVALEVDDMNLLEVEAAIEALRSASQNLSSSLKVEEDV